MPFIRRNSAACTRSQHVLEKVGFNFVREENGFRFYRDQKAGTRTKVVYQFILAKAVVGYGLDLMMAIFKIVQGVITTAINTAGVGAQAAVTMPAEMQDCNTELNLLAVDSRMGSIAHRESCGHCTGIYYDYVRVRPFFQIVSLYGYRSHSAICLHRRAQCEHRQKLP